MRRLTPLEQYTKDALFLNAVIWGFVGIPLFLGMIGFFLYELYGR